MPTQPLQNLFSDASSRVWRLFLEDPARPRTLIEMTRRGISLGLASEVLNGGERAGYVERVRRGRQSSSRLIRPARLLADWTSCYTFRRNLQAGFRVLRGRGSTSVSAWLDREGVRHVRTLYSASRLIAPYVKDPREFFYVDVRRSAWRPLLAGAAEKAGLERTAHGADIILAMPYYRRSVFEDLRRVRGHDAVSNLQLWLDLCGFPPSGREEADHLEKVWKRKGEWFGGD